MKFNTFTKLFMFVFSSVAIIGSFQNCAQSKISNAASDESTSSGGSEISKLEEVDLSKATSLELQLNSLYSLNLRKDKSNLSINLINGEMRHVNLDGRIISPVRLCLFKEELAELKAIIETSKVCLPEAKVAADTVCTQDYIYPYAKVQLDYNEIIKFGEKSGCSKGVDLCEEHKKALNGFISYLSSHVDNRKCL